MADMTPTTTPLPLPAPDVRALLARGEAVVRVRMEPQPCEEHNGRWSFDVGGARGAFYTESQAAYALEHACPWKVGETVDVLEVPGRRVRLALAITAVGVARAEGVWWWTLNGVAKRKGRVTT